MLSLLPAVPAVFLQLLGLVCAVEEAALEELHGDDSEDEHEEHVNDEDVEDVLQGVHHAVKHGLGVQGHKVKGWEERESPSKI